MLKSDGKTLKKHLGFTPQKRGYKIILCISKQSFRKTHSCGISAVPFNTGFIVRATHATKP